MIVNVCPAATSKAPPDRFWEILAATDLLGEWTDAEFLSAEPPGAAQPGQLVHLVAPGFGRKWPVRIDVVAMDAQHRWIDYVAHLPFGVDNHEHLTLTQAPEGGTLIRFN